MDWSKVPSLAALRAFEAAARLQSLSGAARELNVTHAAIAQHVRQLEADLSEPLLFRSGRGVAATDAGLHLAHQLSEGFSIIAEAVTALQRSKEDRPLNVSVTPSFAANWLMPRMGSFWQDHPEISVNINPSINLVDLRRDGFDMAIRFGDGDWPGVESILLTQEEIWVVAATSFLKTHPANTLVEAATLPWVVDTQMIEWHRVVEEAGQDLSDAPMKVMATNDLVLSATLSGLGVSVQPKSLVERDVAANALHCIARLPAKDLGYFLVTLPDRKSANAKAFQKWLLRAAEG